MIHVGLEAFTFPDLDPFTLVDAATQSGYTHIGLRLVDPAANAPALGMDDARRLRDYAKEHGVVLYGADIVNLEGPRDAWADCLATLAAYGVTRLSSFHRGDDLKGASERFADLVTAARPYGITPHIEPVSYFGVRTISQAAQLITDAGGGGITLDTLHFGRVGDDLDLLAELARNIPIWMQVCDGPALDALIPDDADADTRLAALRHESVSQRLAPGEGVCGVADIVRVVRDNIPDPDLVLMVESPDHERVRDLGVPSYAALCRDATLNVATSSATPTGPA